MGYNNYNGIEVYELDATAYSQLNFHCNSSVFTHHKWIESFSEIDKKNIYLCIKHKDTVIAKIAGLGIARPAPFGNELFFFSGPQFIKQNGHDCEHLLQALLKYAKSNSFNRLVISSYDNWQNCIKPIKGGYLNHREDYVFDLTLPDPHLAHNTRFKKNYKKALRVHPKLVENSHEEGLSNLIKLLKTTQNIRRKKKYNDYELFYMPHTNEQQLRHIIKNQLGKIYEIRTDNQVHAVAMNLETNNSVFALFMAYDEFAYKNGLAAFFIHNLIDHYKQKGFTRYNFGGIPKGKDSHGIRIFKESIGTQPVQLNGLTTNFLQYPHKLMNPALHLLRCIRKLLRD